mmetsp:Transcript_32456/g.56129  ORF Transcript_32456/g.56129 Transcript_32456/m.56129 type:complete len:254 (-) Transcript_32456:81-842(-)|eukprot:CAMPEP_0204909926 /NCGR_PEP_ID=MMETSP1397-20131031/8536_1 /ASSEMBLY_ACC=CAM_ASM_000891 /TAXON_ID=49980 /ORGANISM="Climacostomum Climacostomum virens, Strain Stock W-24" /LENGTH=253 /DNA_ID=CAMNT_0052079889 /DNA_START=16 /DNA_END=777 /DNA_ORIENTATION=-
MSVTVSCSNFREASVGKLVKSSKKKYAWEFSIENQDHLVELFHSRVPNKQKVFVDRLQVSFLSPYHGMSASHTFKIQGVLCTVTLSGPRPSLTINGKDFDEIRLAASYTADVFNPESSPPKPVAKKPLPTTDLKENKNSAFGLGFDEWDRRIFETSTQPTKKESQPAPKTPVPNKKPDIPVKAASEIKPTAIPDDLFSPVQRAPKEPEKPIPQFPQANMPVFQIKNLETTSAQVPMQQPFFPYPMMWPQYRRA